MFEVSKIKEKGKNLFNKIINSKYKHICGFLVFLLVVSIVLPTNNSSKNSHMSDSVDLYASNSAGVSFGSTSSDGFKGAIEYVADSIGDSVSSISIAGGSSAPTAPQWNSGLKSEVVREEAYLTTDSDYVESVVMNTLSHLHFIKRRSFKRISSITRFY